MNVVYFCGKGSIWNNNELRYSLRSLRFLQHDKVYLIGEKPYFVNDSVIFLPYPNRVKNAAINIMEKMDIACQVVGGEFLFMNDDYFLTKPVEEFPACYKNTLEEAIKKNKGNEYSYHLMETLAQLQAKGLPTKNFDVHSPMLVNSELMMKVIESFDWNKRYGPTLKSIYFNYYYHYFTGVLKPDCKLAIKRFEPQILRMIENDNCFSIADRAINKSLSNVMNQLYPNKSNYEL